MLEDKLREIIRDNSLNEDEIIAAIGQAFEDCGWVEAMHYPVHSHAPRIQIQRPNINFGYIKHEAEDA